MSAQGVFVINWTEGNNNSMRRPKSKTELKDLVSEGKPDSISYDRISVLLLMEIKKLKEEIEKLKENN